MKGGGKPPDYWFFLSYARTDLSPALEQFFGDLAAAVRPRAALSADLPLEQIGFFDVKGVEIGEEWPPAMLEALQTSRVLVVLLSRGYLGSEYCGKELEVFRRRLDRYRKAPTAGAEPPPVALPILWDFPPKITGALPPLLQDVQNRQPVSADTYSKSGLRTLIDQSRYRDDYVDFRDRFAERLVEVATPRLLPRGEVKRVAEVPSAFTARRDKGAAVGVKRPRSANTARLAFVAGTADELSGVRTDVSGYGDDGREWRPFRPEVDGAVGVLAVRAAAQEELFPETLGLGDEFLEALRRAEEDQAFVLIVVDPWTAKLDGYKQCLAAFDRQRTINAEVLVPTSAADSETAEVRDQLLRDLRVTFQRTFTLNGSTIRDAISTADVFEREVIAAINEIRKRFMQVGALRPVAPDSASPSIPQLSGPGAA